MIIVKEKDPRFVISPEETLFRVIDYPSGVDAKDKERVDARAFRLFRRDEYYISLTRERYASEKAVIEAGANIKKHQMAEDKFYGYVTLPAEIFYSLRDRYRLTLDSYYEPGHEGLHSTSYIPEFPVFRLLENHSAAAMPFLQRSSFLQALLLFFWLLLCSLL